MVTSPNWMAPRHIARGMCDLLAAWTTGLADPERHCSAASHEPPVGRKSVAMCSKCAHHGKAAAGPPGVRMAGREAAGPHRSGTMTSDGSRAAERPPSRQGTDRGRRSGPADAEGASVGHSCLRLRSVPGHQPPDPFTEAGTLPGPHPWSRRCRPAPLIVVLPSARYPAHPSEKVRHVVRGRRTVPRCLHDDRLRDRTPGRCRGARGDSIAPGRLEPRRAFPPRPLSRCDW